MCECVADGNVCYSPFSISLALSMTLEGARGQTAQQLATLLDLQTHEQSAASTAAGLPSRVSREAQKLLAQLTELAGIVNSSEVQHLPADIRASFEISLSLEIANLLFVQKDFKVYVQITTLPGFIHIFLYPLRIYLHSPQYNS